MANVFTRRADHVAKAVLFGLGVLAAVAILRLTGVIPAGAFAGPPPSPVPPRPFSHFHHVAEIGIDCGYCHTTAWRGPRAGYPPVETCAGCHLPQPLPLAALPPPLPWPRVARVPDFVYFDHRAHLTKGVGCAACHGDMGLAHGTVQPIAFTMGFCLDCHRAATKTVGETAAADPLNLTNCYVCHR